MQLILNAARCAVLAVVFGMGLTGRPSAIAQDRCAIAADACIDKAETAFSRCYELCSSDRCYARCDTRYDTALSTCDSDHVACESRPSTSRSSAASPSRPSMAQGNGCYLGECPGDEPVPTPAPSPRPGTGNPQPPVVQPIQYSWICQTPAYWCATANGAWPVGSSCWCSNPMFGNAIGQIVPQQ